MTADEGINAAGADFFVEIDGVFAQGVLRVFGRLARFVFGRFLLVLFRIGADAVGDVVEHFAAANALQIKEIHGMAAFFRQYGHQNVHRPHQALVGRLGVQNGALHHALEA